MIKPYAIRLCQQPVVSIICGVTPNREYLRQRCLAEMIQELRGLPVEFVWCVLADEEWNECKCKNLAAKCAVGRYLIFTNADISIPRILVVHAGDELASTPIVCAMRRDEQPDGTFIDNEHAIGDFQAVLKTTWEQNPFDERFTGWGHLDYDFMARCVGRPVAAQNRIPTLTADRVTHYWHPRLTEDEYRQSMFRNREIVGCKM